MSEFPSFHDPQRLTRANLTCVREVYGLSQQAFFTNPMLWKEVTVRADRNVVDECEADLSTGKPWHREYRIQRSDGQICWVQSKIKPCWITQVHLSGSTALFLISLRESN
jgi:hypothetical protein